MGGVGSGEYTRLDEGKLIADRLPQINSTQLFRKGTIWLEDNSYRAEEEGFDFSYNDSVTRGGRERIELEWTECHYGGYRPWFLCPGGVKTRNDQCNKRVGVLYYHSGVNRYRCRHCLDLSYLSQRTDKRGQAVIRAQKKRWLLSKFFNGCFDEIPPRPRGMHLKTYERLVREIREDEELAYSLHLAKMGKLNDHSKKFLKETSKGLPFVVED